MDRLSFLNQYADDLHVQTVTTHYGLKPATLNRKTSWLVFSSLEVLFVSAF